MPECSRRNVLTALGAFAVAPAARTSDKAGARPPVTGSGEHRYEIQHEWGQPPARIAYGNTHGVCVDSQGFIYIHHTVHADSASSDTVVVFDSDGRFVRSWGGEFRGGAHGLAIRREGGEEFLYFCDTRRAVVAKYSLRGERVWEIGYPEQSPAYQPDEQGRRPSYSPTNLATSLPAGTSMWPTATVRPASTSTTRGAAGSSRFGGKGRGRGGWIVPTESPSTGAAARSACSWPTVRTGAFSISPPAAAISASRPKAW